MSDNHTSVTKTTTSTTTKTDAPVLVGQKYPYAILGGFVLAALAVVITLAFLGVTGPGLFSFTLGAAFLGLGSAILVITAACVFLFFTLRTTSRMLVKHEQELQAVRDLAQDGRLSSLESGQSGARTGASGMMTEIGRLESRIASLEKPRAAPMPAPLVQVVSTKKTVTIPVAARASPFGDVHAVVDVEGIGPIYADLLNAVGIYNTRQLWESDPEQVAATLEIPVATVDKWQQMTELIAIKGIGPQYAELLVRSGVTSIGQLRDANATDLVARVTKAQASSETRIQGNTIGQPTVTNWIRAARDHKAVPTGQTFSGTAK